MRAPSLIRLLAATLVALGLVAPAAHAASGGLGFRVDGDPGSTLVDGFIPIDAAAGTTASGHFIISNTMGTGANLSVYPSDGLTGVTTGVVYGDAGDPIGGAGGWITPDRSSAAMAPRSEQVVNFTVQVPAGAKAGDHVGGVVLEQRRAGSTKTGAITQVVRVVVPVMIEVPGPAAPQVSVKTAAITNQTGSPVLAVTVTLANEGLKLCRPLLKVVMGGQSDTGSQVQRQLDTILPGDRVPYPMPWPRTITPGNHLVHVSASGCGTTDTLTLTLRAPTSQDDTTTVDTTPSTTPDVVTDAVPGAATYKAAKGGKASGDKKKRKKKVDLSTVTGSTAVGGPGAGGGGGAGSGGPGSGAHAADAAGGGAQGKSGLASLLSGAADAVRKHAPAVLERATIPLSLLLLIGLIFFAQEAFDRRDPKLALAPLHREQDLAFDPDPLHTRAVVPTSTGLSAGA